MHFQTSSQFICSLSRRLLIALLAVFPAAAVLASDKVVTVGGDYNYPPYEFINEQGEPDGYNTELTRTIAEVMGIEVRIRLGSWESMKADLEAGNIDILQGISYSEERAKTLIFSPPHSLIHQSVFSRQGTRRIKHLNELNGKSVIVQHSGIMAEELKHSEVKPDFIYVDTHAEALRLLASGQHDYAVVANLPGLYLGEQLSLSNIRVAARPFAARRYGYGTQIENRELLEQFSQGLAILKNTGRQQAIYDKWFGSYEEAELDWADIKLYATGFFAICVLLISGVVIWNRSLAMQVAKRTEELQLQQQQLIQADKMASLGILVSGVAHEINNPTSLLMLNLPVLKDTFEDLEEVLEEYYQEHGDFYLAGLSYSRIKEEYPLMLDDMLEGTRHISRIVNDLRDFARQSPEDLFEPVDLNQVVHTAIRLTDNTIRKSTHHFAVSCQEPLPRFYGNAQRMQQVVINLIVNACQALDSADEKIKISTHYNRYHNRLLLRVKDSGCGIDAEHLKRLKDPFFTTKREQGGTGLGLSISSAIVEEHGGLIEFESKPGKGTTVTLSLDAMEESK